MKWSYGALTYQTVCQGKGVLGEGVEHVPPAVALLLQGKSQAPHVLQGTHNRGLSHPIIACRWPTWSSCIYICDKAHTETWGSVWFWGNTPSGYLGFLLLVLGGSSCWYTRDMLCWELDPELLWMYLLAPGVLFWTILKTPLSAQGPRSKSYPRAGAALEAAF